MTDWNVKRQAGNTHAPLNSRQLVEVEARTLGSSLSRCGAGLVHPLEHLVLFAVIIRVGLLKIITVVFPLRGLGDAAFALMARSVGGPSQEAVPVRVRLPEGRLPPGDRRAVGKARRRDTGNRAPTCEGEGNKQLVDVN